MKANRLISVIVPIYKVEQYLDECVKSIVAQTYSNLEIILVDDGSPDGCPNMCDEWAKRDCRIKVVHKQNGGLSSARNAGLDVANGEYIGFVDSDDYISPEMYEKLYNALESHKSITIAACMVLCDKDGQISDLRRKWILDSERIVGSGDFAERMLLEKSCHTAWNKLYRKEAIGNVRFREGRTNEDTLFMYDLSKASMPSMIEVPQRLYFYRKRENSICTSTERPLQIEKIRNLEEIMGDMRSSRNVKLLKSTRKLYGRTLTYFVKALKNNRAWKERYYDLYSEKLNKLPTMLVITSGLRVKDIIFYLKNKLNQK